MSFISYQVRIAVGFILGLVGGSFAVIGREEDTPGIHLIGLAAILIGFLIVMLSLGGD